MSNVIIDTIGRTRYAIRTAFRRRGALAVIVASAMAYLLTYLFAINKLLPGDGRFEMIVAEDPLRQLFRQSFGTFTYEPVVLFRLGIVTYQFSMNTVIGLGIAILVGINLGISYVVWKQPAACGIGSQSAGLLASIPALLSGTACCAPVIILIIGIQMSSTLLTAFELLLPIAVASLIGTLFFVGRQVNPELVGA